MNKLTGVDAVNDTEIQLLLLASPLAQERSLSHPGDAWFSPSSHTVVFLFLFLKKSPAGPLESFLSILLLRDMDASVLMHSNNIMTSSTFNAKIRKQMRGGYMAGALVLRRFAEDQCKRREIHPYRLL